MHKLCFSKVSKLFVEKICPKWDKKCSKAASEIKHPKIFSSNVNYGAVCVSALVTCVPDSSIHLLVFVKHKSMKTSQANGQRWSHLFSFYQLVSWERVKKNFLLCLLIESHTCSKKVCRYEQLNFNWKQNNISKETCHHHPAGDKPASYLQAFMYMAAELN